MKQGPAEKPDVTITIKENDFVDLMTGKLDGQVLFPLYSYKKENREEKEAKNLKKKEKKKKRHKKRKERKRNNISLIYHLIVYVYNDLPHILIENRLHSCKES